MFVYALGVAHQLLAPLHREQIELLEEIVELVLRPFRIGEALILRIGGDHRLELVAGETVHRARPQVEIGAPDILLKLQRALRVGQPIFENLGNSLDDIGNVGGEASSTLPSSRGFI
jgi:hypothetical protein